jgi:RNA polymerase sigma-70 factor
VTAASFVQRHSRQLRRAYEASGAATWSVTYEDFVAALAASVTHRWAGQEPLDDDVAAYVASLAIGDLALACACRAGHEAAWDHFVRELRPALYGAARAIAGDAGRELADSVYADLFGIADDRPDRRSLLAYYHGRSSLATWLRAVLARRHVDRLRQDTRLRSLDAPETHVPEPAMSNEPQDPDRARFVRLAQHGIDALIAELDPGDRLRLRLYYGEGLTLAEIGRVVHEHEATVSRKLNRARERLRKGMESVLRERHGLNSQEVQACLEHAAGAPELHLSRLLSRSPGDEA